MNKITKDCYVNVKDWTDEEVLEAAEIFAANVEGAYVDYDSKTALQKHQRGYEYLMLIPEDDGLRTFVNNKEAFEHYNIPKELTKEDFFGCSNGIRITITPTVPTEEIHMDFKVGDKVVVKDLLPLEVFND